MANGISSDVLGYLDQRFDAWVEDDLGLVRIDFGLIEFQGWPKGDRSFSFDVLGAMGRRESVAFMEEIDVAADKIEQKLEEIREALR